MKKSLLTYIIKRIVWYVKRLFGHKPNFEITSEFQEALDILENTHDSVLITGKAGTGKSALLRFFARHTGKKYAIIAPTGVAAQNIDGRTIHSFFHFAPGIKAENVREERNLVDKLLDIEMIIIDEISMVRADLMECVEQSLRMNKHSEEPFGGVQMVFVGDLYQLPPVVTDNDVFEIKRRYGGKYFFHAPVFEREFQFRLIELTKVFRQDKHQNLFKEILNRIRVGEYLPQDISMINKRHEKLVGNDNESIIITTTNVDADDRNAEKLEKLDGNLYTFVCEYDGDYRSLVESESNVLPAPVEIKLKKKAHIIMLNNDAGRRWVNGSLGVVDKIDEKHIWVRLENGNTHLVEQEKWENMDAAGNITGYYKQYPIQLAYAITIHKSQGKSFDSICINVGKGTWEPGHLYVALSRCKSLEGITLLRAVAGSDIIVDPVVTKYLQDGVIIRENQPEFSINEIINWAINNHQRICMTYKNLNNEVSKKYLGGLSSVENDPTIFKGFYDNENHPRTFRKDRIIDIMIL